jgi:hypothetical protein
MKLMVNENRDVSIPNTLDYLVCLCEVVRVEMTGARWPESRMSVARILRNYETLLNSSKKIDNPGKD